MTWKTSWTTRALKDMDRLDIQGRERIFHTIDRVAETGHGDLKRLKGPRKQLRIRVGDLRVFINFEQDAGIMRILRVLHRREAYRD